jgi:hypothetical protein
MATTPIVAKAPQSLGKDPLQSPDICYIWKCWCIDLVLYCQASSCLIRLYMEMLVY